MAPCRGLCNPATAVALRWNVISHCRGGAYVRHMTRILALALALLPATLLPCGAEVLRQEDIVKAELLPGWREADGRQMAALHLQLRDEWKTYWRAPGDAGVPPEFDWSGSDNLASVRPIWPRPNLFEFQGMQTIGYQHSLVLPLEVTPLDASKPVVLRASIDLGLCKDICVPAQLVLGDDLPMPGAPDPLIALALRSLPQDGPSAGLADLACTTEALDDGLRVTARMTLPQGSGPETVVMEPEAPVWVSDATVSRDGNVLIAQADFVPSPGQSFDLHPDTLRLTVLDEARAVEVTGCPLR